MKSDRSFFFKARQAFVRWSRSFSGPSKQKKPRRGLPPAPGQIDSVSRIAPEVLAVLDNPQATIEERADACNSLVRFGEFGRAVVYLSAMLEEPALREFAQSTLLRIRSLKQMGMGAIRRPRSLPQAPDGTFDDTGYWVVPADSETTVIAFTGKAMRLDISIYFMQRILKRFGVNVIYVFDWADAFYFAGVKGLGKTPRKTVARLRVLCTQLGTKRLICFGQSSGGYAAIRYGAKLGADGVLAFSPVILPVMKRHILDDIERATGRRPPQRCLDLRLILGRGGPRVPHTKIVYGDANRADVRSARHISDLPNVVEHVLAGVSTHGTVEATTVTGEFPDIFRTFCEEVGPGRWAKPRRATSGRRSPG